MLDEVKAFLLQVSSKALTTLASHCILNTINCVLVDYFGV